MLKFNYVVHYSSHKSNMKVGLKIYQLREKALYIFCFLRPDEGGYIILDLRKVIMAYNRTPFIEATKR